MKTRELNPRQQAFVYHYLKCLNAREAAEEAGYKKPEIQGKRLKRHPVISKEIKRAMDKRNKKLEIDAEFVLRELTRVYSMLVNDVKPALGKSGKPIKDADGNPLYTFQAAPALKALELIGKHIDVTAFDTKVNIQVTRDQELIDAIRRGRRQAGQIAETTYELLEDQSEAE